MRGGRPLVTVKGCNTADGLQQICRNQTQAYGGHEACDQKVYAHPQGVLFVDAGGFGTLVELPMEPIQDDKT